MPGLFLTMEPANNSQHQSIRNRLVTVLVIVLVTVMILVMAIILLVIVKTVVLSR